MDLYSLISVGQMRHQEMLKEAENRRRTRKVRRDQPGARGRILGGIGDALIATGQWLKGDGAVHQTRPTLQVR